MLLLASVLLTNGIACHLSFPVLAPAIKQATIPPTLIYEIQLDYFWLQSGDDSGLRFPRDGR